MKKNAGFTLIELVAVMVIVAIIAVIAIPQFTDLKDEAAEAAAAGVGGAIASATAMNYAKGIANGGGAQEVTGCTATQFDDLLVGASASDATTLTISGRTYTIGAADPGNPTVATGATLGCTIKDDGAPNSDPVTFHIVGCDAGCKA